MDATQIIPIIIAIIAASPGIFAFVSQLRKEKVDSVKVAQDAMLSVILPMKDEISRLQTKISELETKVKEKDDKIDELEKLVDKRNLEIEERNRRIDDLETEVNNLRSRLEIVEKRKRQN